MANKTQIVLGAMSIKAAADLEMHRFIGADGNYCGADKKAAGVTDLDISSGGQATVNFSGILLVETGGAITVTDEPVAVSSDASGRAVETIDQEINGYALDSAAGAGEFVRIRFV